VFRPQRWLPFVAIIAVSPLAAQQPARDHSHAPPPAPYQAVSKLVPLPDFIPGLGTLFVDPATLPAGPFLAYDQQGNLVSSIYMVPLKDLQAHKAFDNLKVGQAPADHVDIYYNQGHAGVADPHYHFVVWYVSRARAESLKAP
jgi:hypothetical protein